MNAKSTNSDSCRVSGKFDHPPCDRAMVLEANLDHHFLETRRKLVLICEKIRTTMNSPAKVTHRERSQRVCLLESQGVAGGLMAKADVNDWQAAQYVVIPEGLLLGRWRPV